MEIRRKIQALRGNYEGISICSIHEKVIYQVNDKMKFSWYYSLDRIMPKIVVNDVVVYGFDFENQQNGVMWFFHNEKMKKDINDWLDAMIVYHEKVVVKMIAQKHEAEKEKRAELLDKIKDY